MSVESREAGRPAAPGPNADPTSADLEDGGSLCRSLPPADVDDWIHAAHAVNGVFVAIVRRATDGATYRRAYFTLDAARALANRARARGDGVSIVVAELRPAFNLPALTGAAEHSSPELDEAALFTEGGAPA